MEASWSGQSCTFPVIVPEDGDLPADRTSVCRGAKIMRRARPLLIGAR